MPIDHLILAVLIFAAAVLYSSVGHAGASGYLAAMALVGLAPAMMKPTALTLNILVAVIGTYKFYRAGAFSWSLFWPFAVASVPFAFLGGTLALPGHIYKPVVGVVLIYAAWRSFRSAGATNQPLADRPFLPILLIAGAAIGFLSGLTGVGGGIFLSPLLLLCRWAEVRVISGIAAGFILVNSVAGLLGAFTSGAVLAPSWPYWAAAAVAGGFIGAEYGSRRLAGPTLRRILAAVLVVAGVKMIAGV